MEDYSVYRDENYRRFQKKAENHKVKHGGITFDNPFASTPENPISSHSSFVDRFRENSGRDEDPRDKIRWMLK